MTPKPPRPLTGCSVDHNDGAEAGSAGLQGWVQDGRLGRPLTRLGIEIAGAIHRLQLSASQKDHPWTQTAAIGDPVPHPRWVHRIQHPGCFGVWNSTSPGPEIPCCVESEI